MSSPAKRETVTITRDVEVIQIPAGTKYTLTKGTDVMITQFLGGTWTVYSISGELFRVDGRDADAIGEEKPVGAISDIADLPIEQQVWETLKTCYDPEIPVNIVDLGLVYLCEVQPLATGGYRADIRMTLTAPGCGMGGVLKEDVERRVNGIPGVKETYVDLVFDPAWEQSMMSEAARLHLNLY